MMREDSGLLQKNDKNLFGKKFGENINHTLKSKKQTLEILPNTSRTKYKPFRHGFPDTKKEFRRATTKASCQKRNDVTVFEKMIQ